MWSVAAFAFYKLDVLYLILLAQFFLDQLRFFVFLYLIGQLWAASLSRLLGMVYFDRLPNHYLYICGLGLWPQKEQ